MGDFPGTHAIDDCSPCGADSPRSRQSGQPSRLFFVGCMYDHTPLYLVSPVMVMMCLVYQPHRCNSRLARRIRKSAPTAGEGRNTHTHHLQTWPDTHSNETDTVWTEVASAMEAALAHAGGQTMCLGWYRGLPYLTLGLLLAAAPLLAKARHLYLHAHGSGLSALDTASLRPGP